MRMLQTFLAVALLGFTALAMAGEFGDHCTTGLANGRLIKTKCDVSTMYEGKTYCFGSQQARTEFMQDPKTTIEKAAAFWAENAEPVRDKLDQAAADAIVKSAACDLSDKDVGYLNFNGADLHHCKLVNTSFFGADLRNANLSGTDMRRAYLNLARLEGTNLSGADLADAIIFQAIFDKTNFAGANMTNARVIGTLGAVDMNGVNAKKGRFGLDIGNQPMGQMKFDSVGGNFANANFEGADLNIASFRFGDLRNANLRNANLYRADLIRADLRGADLTGANLTDADVDGANFADVKGWESVKGLDTVKGKYRR